MTEKVIVIDPGERVGWARCTIEDGAITPDSVVHGVHALKDFALKFAESVTNYDHVIYETWRLRPDMAKRMVGNDFQPVQLIGMIRLLAWQNPTIGLHSLAPSVKSTGHKVMPDHMKARLEHCSEEHDQDALALLSYWWWNKYV